MASEWAAPALRAAARAHAGPQTPLAEWRRGVILGHNHIGDVLCRTASLGPLRDALPDCEWDYVVSPHAAELLEHEPAVRDVWRVERGAGRWPVRGPWRAMQRARYDVALCTNALGPEGDFVLAAALRIPNRVGVGHKGLSGLLTRAVDAPRNSPPGACFRALVGDLTGRAPTWDLAPALRTTADDVRDAAHAWDALSLGGARVIACAVSSRQRQPRWPAERFVRALAAAHAATGAVVAYCGTRADESELEALRAASTFPAHVLAGELSVRAFAEFLRRCAAVLTVDTGTRHLANAVGAPVVYFRNLWTTPGEGGAYVATERDLLADVARTPSADDARRALDSVTPETVAAALAAAVERQRE